ncbi:MAG: hypothetical protein IIZ74_05230, partial [Erysipelotrichaceae bacterium]|nr:hypothetical protein [Erysipelotrichaceae bacterium]
TIEQQRQLQNEVTQKMKRKLIDDNIQEEADKFARQVIWSMYQPVITAVASGYTLDVVSG